MQIDSFIVEKAEEGLRLGSYLSLKTALSTNKIRDILERNGCLIQGHIEKFSSYKISAKEKISFYHRHLSKNELPAPLIFENEAFIAINKPPFVPSTDPHLFPFPCHLVHRLDKDTSGVLLAAKTKEAEKLLTLFFKNRAVEKRYIAIVDGCVKKETWTKEGLLSQIGSFHGQTVYGTTHRDGLYAKTLFKVVKRLKKATIVLCLPVTGRTHQIRVHLKESGHPILGDAQYGESFKCSYIPDRQLLHAFRLTMHAAPYQGLQIESPSPQDFEIAIEHLK